MAFVEFTDYESMMKVFDYQKEPAYIRQKLWVGDSEIFFKIVHDMGAPWSIQM